MAEPDSFSAHKHESVTQDGNLGSTGQQVRDLQSTVARLEGQDAEAAKAAEVLKARVTLLEGSVRLLQSAWTCRLHCSLLIPHL